MTTKPKPVPFTRRKARQQVRAWAFLIVWNTLTPSPVACETKAGAIKRRADFLRDCKDCGPIVRIDLPLPTKTKGRNK